jgi:TonB family protein
LMAGLNRCLFWFHPAAWWLERQLAMLAEQACDDEALLQLGGRETYAQALLDMAAAVKRGGGRLVWEAMAMAKASEVRMRIERILDETRQVSQGVSRLRWAALLTCSLPMIYVASVAQLVPARAQEQSQIAHTANAGQPDFGQMEQFVAAHPDDLEARSKLIRDYFLYSIKQPRLNHIFWMIQNHPESDLTALNSTGILPRTSPTNDESDYQTAANLWRQQVAVHAGDAHVLANAARFLGQAGGDPDEAERLLNQARSLDSRTNSYTQQLGRLYFNSLLANAGDAAFPAGPANPSFAAKTRSELEASTDSTLLSYVGSQLSSLGRSPNAVGPAQVDLTAHPAIADLVDLGNRLVARGRPLAGQQMPVFAIPRQNRSMQNAPAPPPPPPVAPMAAGTEPKPAVPQMIRVGGLVQAAKLMNKIQPGYPQAARDAGIEGVVELQIVIAKDGTIASTQVIDGNPILAAAAQQAVAQWQYKPTLLNGEPVQVTTSVNIPFTLQ